MTEPLNSLPIDNLPPNPFVLVNLKQTPEERRAKFWLCRSMGYNNAQSRRMRDWRLAKIERCLGLAETYDIRTQTYGRQLNTA